MDRLEAIELVPFHAWKEAGLSSIMTAHVIFEALDAEYPATMSKAVLTGLLRERIGYEGLIITDDIEMKATFDHYGYKAAATLGLAAGVDNFLCCHTADVANGIVDCLADAVARGDIPETRLFDASERVSKFVARFARGPEPLAREKLATAESARLISELLGRVDPKVAELGIDPTEAMEAIRVERERKKALEGAS
jgi:beta-N-acetylhexosaminidase